MKKLSLFFFAFSFFAQFYLVQAAPKKDPAQLLYNPLPTPAHLYCPTASCDLKEMFLFIVSDILRVLPIVAVVMIIVGGYKMIIARGNEEAYIEAKRTITWAVLGLIIALLSYSIVAIVLNLLGANLTY